MILLEPAVGAVEPIGDPPAGGGTGPIAILERFGDLAIGSFAMIYAAATGEQAATVLERWKSTLGSIGRAAIGAAMILYLYRKFRKWVL